MARESVYKVDVDAAVNAGAKVKTITISKKGANGKTYNRTTQEIDVTDLNQALAVLSGNEEHVWSLLTSRLNQMIQANDRRKLTIDAEGPERAIKDMVAALVDGGAFDEAEAIDIVVAKLKAKGELPEDYTYTPKAA
jgi:hypothetical protein